MIEVAGLHPVPVELTADPSFGRRIGRLAVVSAVALGLISALAVTALDAPEALGVAFAAGWLLMPATLLASLRRPRLRYALVVPASLVSMGLLAVCIGWPPADPMAAAGWLLMAAGVAFGGGLGLWFWYRLLPVPAAFHDPFSAGRWALIGVHIALIVAGFGLVALAGRD